MNTTDADVRALAALCARSGGAETVAATIHSSRQTLTQIINGVQLPSGKPRGVGRDLRARLDKHYPGWIQLQYAHTGGQKALQAQDMSHPWVTVVPPVLTEDQVNSGMESVFLLEVKDSSGGDNYPRGSFIMWSRTRQHQIGEIVLARDSHQQLHIRRMRQGTQPGHWVAEALHPAYANLDSETNKLTIVGVFEGYRRSPN